MECTIKPLQVFVHQTFYKQTQCHLVIFNWHSYLSLCVRVSHTLKVDAFKRVSKHVQTKIKLIFPDSHFTMFYKRLSPAHFCLLSFF